MGPGVKNGRMHQFRFLQIHKQTNHKSKLTFLNQQNLGDTPPKKPKGGRGGGGRFYFTFLPGQGSAPPSCSTAGKPILAVP